MVISCVAVDCNNDQYRNKIPFHRFPFKRPDILNLWIEAVQRENWTPSKTSRLCGEHFVQSDYINRPGLCKKILKPHAVPSVFVYQYYSPPRFAGPHRKILRQDIPVKISQQIKVEENEDSKCFDIIDYSPSDSTIPFISNENAAVFDDTETAQVDGSDEESKFSIDIVNHSIFDSHSNGVFLVDRKIAQVRDSNEAIPSTSNSNISMLVDTASQTNHDINPSKIINLKRQVKTLKQTVKRKNDRIATLKSLLSSILKSGTYKTISNENLDFIETL